MVSQHTLSKMAWEARSLARVRSGTPVGCAVMAKGGQMWAAPNIELEFRLGMHAEINALSGMLAERPSYRAWAICIAAEAERFTPCGSCLDWVIQLAEPGCTLFVESKPGLCELITDVARLMPFYPVRGND